MATYDYDYIEDIDTLEEEVVATRGVNILGIDFTDGSAIMSNADLKRIGAPENLLQRIIKYLRTEKDLYKIYTAELNEAGVAFGFSIYETIGHTYTSVTLSKYSLEIRNFLNNEYDVETVDSVNMTPVEDKILVTIRLVSIYGEVEIKEVINDNYYLYGKGA